MKVDLRIEYKDINPLELLEVADYLDRRGTQSATIYKGNQCVWVASGSASCPINEYFIFRDGKLVDIQID